MESIKVEDLFESPIFQCKSCGKRLSAPIMDVPNVGNICGRCFKKNPSVNAKENIDILNILSKLQVSCLYSKQGCSFQHLFSEITAHEDICSYKEKICPFAFINKCSVVPIPSVSKHIKTEHPQCVHHYNSNIVKIEFSLEYEFEEFHLLTVNEDDYLLRVKLDIVNNFLLFGIYCFKFTEKSKFVIRHENEDFCTKNRDCNVIPELHLAPAFDSNSATSFNLTLLKKCFNKTLISIIELVGPSFEISNTKLLKCMECPVCNEYMNLQIRQCSQGHSICKDCRQKLQECPLCKSGFGASRNYMLESVSSLMYFPCKNRDCKRYITGEMIEKHELECKFKYHQCPFLIKLNCKWKGLYEEITEHLLAAHSDYTEFHNFIKRKITLDYANHKYDTICIILGEHIFKVCVCLSGINKLFLTYGLYGPVNPSCKFIWETGIYHKNSDKHKFVVRDICSSYTTTNYKLDVEGYDIDDTIYFYHKIIPNI